MKLVVTAIVTVTLPDDQPREEAFEWAESRLAELLALVKSHPGARVTLGLVGEEPAHGTMDAKFSFEDQIVDSGGAN
jgi:hypothetical protein